jgi:hypothetical protein
MNARGGQLPLGVRGSMAPHGDDLRRPMTSGSRGVLDGYWCPAQEKLLVELHLILPKPLEMKTMVPVIIHGQHSYPPPPKSSKLFCLIKHILVLC